MDQQAPVLTEALLVEVPPQPVETVALQVIAVEMEAWHHHLAMLINHMAEAGEQAAVVRCLFQQVTEEKEETIRRVHRGELEQVMGQVGAAEAEEEAALEAREGPEVKAG